MTNIEIQRLRLAYACWLIRQPHETVAGMTPEAVWARFVTEIQG